MYNSVKSPAENTEIVTIRLEGSRIVRTILISVVDGSKELNVCGLSTNPGKCDVSGNSFAVVFRQVANTGDCLHGRQEVHLLSVLPDCSLYVIGG